MADAKPRKARRVALGTAALALVWLFGVWPPPLWWRDHRPRATAMMREAEGWQAGSSSNLPAVHPTALRDISPVLQRMVIIAEDSRFRTHHGIDPAEIADAVGIDQTKGWRGTIVAAWRHRDRLRGASTITQQLAKNLWLSSSRNPLRKVKEAILTWQLERSLSKRRILELYLNVIELGPGIYGVGSAAERYFGKPAADLGEDEAALLAASLPRPSQWHPGVTSRAYQR